MEGRKPEGGSSSGRSEFGDEGGEDLHGGGSGGGEVSPGVKKGRTDGFAIASS
jgi:hypothetical protein